LWNFFAHRGEAVVAEPPGFEELGDFEVGWEAGGFLNEGVGAEAVGALNIAGLGRGAEDDDHDVFEVGLSAKPGEEFKAADFGEFEVEEDEAREWKLVTVGERARAGEVVHGRLAVGDAVEGALDAGPFEGKLDKFDVGLLVFDVEDAVGHKGKG